MKSAFFCWTTLIFVFMQSCMQKEASPVFTGSSFVSRLNELRQTGTNCNGGIQSEIPWLIWNDQLGNAAQSHASDMYSRSYFDHVSPENETPLDRTKQHGYSGVFLGENLARGHEDEHAVLEAWTDSPDHCLILRLENANEVGAGYDNSYWVLLIGQNK